MGGEEGLRLMCSLWGLMRFGSDTPVFTIDMGIECFCVTYKRVWSMLHIA